MNNIGKEGQKKQVFEREEKVTEEEWEKRRVWRRWKKGGKNWRNIKGKRNKVKLLSWLVLHPIHLKKESLPND